MSLQHATHGYWSDQPILSHATYGWWGDILAEGIVRSVMILINRTHHTPALSGRTLSSSVPTSFSKTNYARLNGIISVAVTISKTYQRLVKSVLIQSNPINPSQTKDTKVAITKSRSVSAE